MAEKAIANTASYRQIADIPTVDLPANLRAALGAGKKAIEIAADVLALRKGPGKLTPQEYFYYRLWDGHRERADKRRFVGKIAQHPMHVAAGAREWFAASADKILFHSVMNGVALPTPELIVITQDGRFLPNAPTIADPAELAAKLRRSVPLPALRQAGGREIQPLRRERRQLRC